MLYGCQHQPYNKSYHRFQWLVLQRIPAVLITKEPNGQPRCFRNLQISSVFNTQLFLFVDHDQPPKALLAPSYQPLWSPGPSEQPAHISAAVWEQDVNLDFPKLIPTTMCALRASPFALHWQAAVWHLSLTAIVKCTPGCCQLDLCQWPNFPKLFLGWGLALSPITGLHYCTHLCVPFELCNCTPLPESSLWPPHCMLTLREIMEP